jgi:putative transposase
LQGYHNNNKMELLNGEVRDREKTMRTKKADTLILGGYQIFYNRIRSHKWLNGMTPAKKCGITIKRDNQWTTLIKNASNRNQ